MFLESVKISFVNYLLMTFKFRLIIILSSPSHSYPPHTPSKYGSLPAAININTRMVKSPFIDQLLATLRLVTLHQPNQHQLGSNNSDSAVSVCIKIKSFYEHAPLLKFIIITIFF